MRFSYTHHMPYTGVGESGQDWPVPNKQFDPKQGVEMFERYIEDKVYAEQAGFDWIASNEHHFFKDAGAADKFKKKTAIQHEVTFDKRVERGLLVCGTPEMAIDQIKRIHSELGNGRMNLSVKIGNIADHQVTRTLDYLRDIVFPAVRSLGEDTDPAQAAE